jgi:hypothetical protein
MTTVYGVYLRRGDNGIVSSKRFVRLVEFRHRIVQYTVDRRYWD